MRRVRTLTAAVMLTTISLAASAITEPARAERDGHQPGSLAEYNGRIIDLAVSWEGAQACRIAEPINVCFDTEAELDAFPLPGDGEFAPLADCSTSVRLYDGTNYATPVVEITVRWTTVSLSTYGFAAKTSSYKIGACSAAFYDASNTYPGTTTSGTWSSSMVSGWNNRITRVYLS